MKVSFEQLKTDFWSLKCNSMDILKSDAVFGESRVVPFDGFNQVTEIYAHLYYLLQGQNYKDFIYQLDRSQENRNLFNNIRRRVEVFWDNNKPDDLNDSFYSFIEEPQNLIYKATVENARHSIELLFYMMSWLLTLDDYFGLFYSDYVIVEDHCPIKTRRGELVFRPVNEVTMLLNELRSSVSRNNARVGVDYLCISNACSNIDLFTPDDNYRVSHIPIHTKIPKGKAGPVKFGLIPGEIKDSQKYKRVETGEAWGGKRRFVITRINEPEYHTRKQQALNEMLRECSIIVMPELATPLNYQLAYGEHLARESSPGLILLAPGSFHMTRSELFDQIGHLPLLRNCRVDPYANNPIYNAAFIYDRRGNILAPVTKTNRFEYGGLVEDITYECNHISIFETRIGRIAILICVDFLVTDIQRLLSDRMVDFVFVMSMTPNPHGGEFQRATQRLSNEIKAIIIICNNNALWRESGDKPNIVIAVPGMEAQLHREEYYTVNLDNLLGMISGSQAYLK